MTRDEAPTLLHRIRAALRPTPPVTIVVPRADDRSALDAVLAQRPAGATILLVGPPGARRSPHPVLGPDPTIGALLRHTAAPLLIVLAPGVRPAPHAIPCLLAEAAADPGADLVYADEDHLPSHDPFHKPAWNIDLALEQDLVGAICLIRRALLQPLAAETLPHSLQDLALLAAPGRVRHVPALLAHRSTPRPGHPTPTIVERALAALPPGPSTPELVPSRYGPRHRVRWRLPNPAPRVSVVIPTRDQPALLAGCTQGLLHRTDYADLEILIADNGSTAPEALDLLARLRTEPRIRILDCPGPFDYAAINNAAVRAATGTVLLLMNNDVDVIEPGWLAEMVGHALRPDVGAVGARLLFEDGSIQHAGIVGGVGRFDGGPGVAGHFGLAARPPDPGHGDQFILTRELLAVTGACLALRRAVFIEAGGFDATHLRIALNDLDLCLRIRTLGYRIVWTPFAELYHLESASRGPDDAPGTALRFHQECRTIRDRWGPVLDADPFYNPAFSRADHSFQLRQA